MSKILLNVYELIIKELMETNLIYHTSPAMSTVVEDTVRIAIFSCTLDRMMKKKSNNVFLRLGRMTVETPKDFVLKSQETQRLTLLRMLIAVITFHRYFKRILLDKDVTSLNRSVSACLASLSRKYSKKPIEETCHTVEELLKTESPNLIAFHCPNTLLIDTSLNSREVSINNVLGQWNAIKLGDSVFNNSSTV